MHKVATLLPSSQLHSCYGSAFIAGVLCSSIMRTTYCKSLYRSSLMPRKVYESVLQNRFVCHVECKRLVLLSSCRLMQGLPMANTQTREMIYSVIVPQYHKTPCNTHSVFISLASVRTHGWGAIQSCTIIMDILYLLPWFHTKQKLILLVLL